MSALPPPTATYDLVTDLGTVRAYEWSSPAVTETVPVVLIPGRSSGVPMWSENLPGFLTDHRVIAFDALGDAGCRCRGRRWNRSRTRRSGCSRSSPNSPLGSPPRRPLLRRSDCRDLRAPVPRPRGLADAPRTGLHLRVPSCAPHGMGDALVPSTDRVRNAALGKVGGVEYDPNDDMAKMIAAGSSTSRHHFLNRPARRRPATGTDHAHLRRDRRPRLLGWRGAAADRARRLPDGTVEVWPDTTHSLPMQVKDKLDSRLKGFWAASE